MKAARIIILLIISLLALATIEVDAASWPPQVLDYRTGEPIRRLDGCIMKAFYNGSHYNVDERDHHFVRLRLGERPLRLVRFIHVKEGADSIDDNITVQHSYHMRFSDSKDLWNNLWLDRLRISENQGVITKGGNFYIEETKESRVYNLKFDFDFELYATVYKIGMVITSFSQHYFLSPIIDSFSGPAEFYKNIIGVTEHQHSLLFTFEKADL